MAVVLWLVLVTLPILMAQSTAGVGTVINCGVQDKTSNTDDKLSHIEEMLTKLTTKDTDMNCPDNFKSFNNTCYFFGTLPIGWYKAKVACQQMGAKLAAVETYGEDQFIVNTLRELNPPGVNGYFTSGNDLTTHGVWIWDSTGLSMAGYSRWDRGQGPAQARLSDHNTHVYWKPSNFMWHDHPATATDCGFICEK